MTTKRRMSLVLLLGVLAGGLALSGCGGTRYGGVDLTRYVPAAYLDDVRRALEDAGENGPTLAAAIVEAPEEDREALSFLIAELPVVDLATVEKDFLLETVRLARKARQAFPWGATVPDEIYLHYVLPPRVSQEPLENWRPFLLGELSERLAGITSMTEAALEVNRWCGERVGFKPTQRRDQGVFETLASGYGRCEEMMIVHIAALRSVCIPARQTWTPFWATCDNNHAWTELWVDGGWHYTGACEPKDSLDDAWFAGPAKNAAIVLSSVFGSPAPGEDVYREEDRFSLVNSVSHYLEPGTLRIRATQDGRPRADVPVTVAVWNFGGLRAIARKETDADGNAEIALGDGTYFVCAGDHSGHDWSVAVIVAGQETQIKVDLAKTRPFDSEFWLRYSEED